MHAQAIICWHKDQQLAGGVSQIFLLGELGNDCARQTASDTLAYMPPQVLPEA